MQRTQRKAPMASDIIIVSGFLGAGKTTLIQEWLKSGAFPGKIAIVENDFGEVNVDAALLRSNTIHVTELSAGCICCSLSGDFVRALETLITRHAPDTILIEPSGVGMLTDVQKACVHPRIQPLARVLCAVTVVDIHQMQRYLENFGAFYEDQIRRADAIILSRTQEYPEQIAGATERIISLNANARIFSESWNQLSVLDIVNTDQPKPEKRIVIGRRTTAPHAAKNSIMADDVFQTVTIHSSRVFLPAELHARLQEAEESSKLLIRAKGVLHSTDGYCLVQYTEGETQIEPSYIPGGFLCLIGQGLDSQLLQRIFSGA